VIQDNSGLDTDVPRSLCIMPTFQCPAQCRHCGTNSHPREATWLSSEHILGAIDQAAAAGFVEVVFTGGEPTLADRLSVWMRHARRLGLSIRLVTNAHWAQTQEAAGRCLDELIANGLTHVTVSTGDEHVRFVPLASVINAARGCVERKLPATIAVEASMGRAVSARALQDNACFQEIWASFPDAALDVVDSTWMPLSPFRYGRYGKDETVNKDNLDRRRRCEQIFSTTTLQADGTLSPCCGLGIRFTADLKLGNIRDVSLQEADALARQSFLGRWISTEGPERILAWAAGQDPKIDWEDRYAHQCQACIRVLSDPQVRALVDARRHEKAPTVEFLETLLTPAPLGFG
jgi:hypothetical protein